MNLVVLGTPAEENGGGGKVELLQRGAFEQACLQPLSTCIAELRRWQGVQRAAHERLGNLLRSVTADSGLGKPRPGRC